MTSLLDGQTIQMQAFLGVNSVMAMMIGVWSCALYRTVRSDVYQIPPEENCPKLDRISEVSGWAAPTIWYERNASLYLGVKERVFP
ncbi:MAG: hypothetical protein VX910_02780 [Candidatus Latescibacterota bacterium]|nr:hypothetical protein [Candidatus Latescibacterota bacterium]